MNVTFTVLDIVSAMSQSCMGFLVFLICAMQGLSKRLLCKYYSNFFIAYKKQANRLDMRQFILFG